MRVYDFISARIVLTDLLHAPRQA